MFVYFKALKDVVLTQGIS